MVNVVCILQDVDVVCILKDVTHQLPIKRELEQVTTVLQPVIS